ncbi:MAG: DMT family transporter [Sphingobacteriales bacterium]|jgi:drug/metabolite transporter (DMT)-like permease|nr:DMT family transporter [Sphingobacteriales bacterium]MBP9140872.1 DMT family transporter [Chitinophagales bacterium]MDA0197594.1 DMT family transporter [Bacteroidota bacterium]MBK6889135.1 DMT family transporter [Sphingobacteriales bacterium]MBK7528361.1 DMT family transporter [Sphingobacteriales bacterium]
MEKAISLKYWAMLILLALIWGSSFIFIKRGLVAFSFYEVACLRMFFTFLFVCPIFLQGRWVRKITARDWALALVVALTGSGIPAFLYPLAQTHISSAAAGIFNALTPLFTYVVGLLAFGVLFYSNKLIGVLLGFAGAAGLMAFGQGLTPATDNRYGIFAILATVCYAISANTINRYCSHIPAPRLTAMAFASLVPVSGGYLLGFSNVAHRIMYEPAASTSAFYLLLLALFGTALGSIFYFKLNQETTPLFASTTTYIMPITSTLWGWSDGEPIDWAYLPCCLLILLGVYLAAKK